MPMTLTVRVDGETTIQRREFKHENLALKAFAETIMFADTQEAILLNSDGFPIAQYDGSAL